MAEAVGFAYTAAKLCRQLGYRSVWGAKTPIAQAEMADLQAKRNIRIQHAAPLGLAVARSRREAPLAWLALVGAACLL